MLNRILGLNGDEGKVEGECRPSFLTQLLERVCEHDEYSPAFIQDAPTPPQMCYGEFKKSVFSFAAALDEQVLPHTEMPMVAILLPDSPQVVIAMLSGMLTGCCITVLNPMVTPSELEYQLKECGPTVLITNTRYISKAMHVSYSNDQHTLLKRIVLLPCVMDEKKDDTVDLMINKFSEQPTKDLQLLSYDNIISSAKDFVRDNHLRSPQFLLASFVFKHGKQKAPTLVTYDEQALDLFVAQLTAHDCISQLKAGEVVLGSLGFFNVHTLMLLCSTLFKGATYVYDGLRHEANLAATAHHHSASLILLYPSHIRKLVSLDEMRWDGVNCSLLKAVVCIASCPLDETLVQLALSLLIQHEATEEVSLWQLYGFSSWTPFTHSYRVKCNEVYPSIAERFKQLLRRNRGVNREGFVPLGKAMNNVDCIISPLPVNYGSKGHLGEVHYRLFKETYDIGCDVIGEVCVYTTAIPNYIASGKSNVHEREGYYMCTGEVGFRDIDGKYWVLPSFNKRQVLHIDGCEVTPGEIESALSKCTGVSQSYGLLCPHPKGYPSEFVVKALVVQNEVVSFSKGSLGVKLRDSILSQLKSHLAQYKIPSIRYRDQNGIIFSNDLPMINNTTVDHWSIYSTHCNPTALSYYHNALESRHQNKDSQTQHPNTLLETTPIETKEHLSTPTPYPRSASTKHKPSLYEENRKLRHDNESLNKEMVDLIQQLSTLDKSARETKEELREALRKVKEADGYADEKRVEMKSLQLQVQKLKDRCETMENTPTSTPQHHQADDVNSMKEELNLYKKRCALYEDSLAKQHTALIESEERTRASQEMRQDEHEKNTFRLQRLNAALEGCTTTDVSPGEDSKEDHLPYTTLSLNRLLQASKKEIQYLTNWKGAYTAELTSMKNRMTALTQTNERLERMCHKLNVENAVAVDFMLKLNTHNATPNKENLVSNHAHSSPFSVSDLQCGSPKIKIHRTGSMEISLDDDTTWTNLECTNKEVINCNVSFDVELINEKMVQLQEFFDANDMIFPMKEAKNLEYHLLLPHKEGVFKVINVGMEQNRLVAKEKESSDQYSDLIKMLLSY